MTIASPEAPSHPVALLLVDVINDFDFPEGDGLLALAVLRTTHICGASASLYRETPPPPTRTGSVPMHCASWK